MMTCEERLRRFREEKEKKERKEKKKREEAKQEAYKKYQAAYRKAHGHKPRQEQTRERLIKQKRLEKEREVREKERQERLIFIEQRTVSVYGEKWNEKELPEEALYTKEELQNPPEGERGRLSERFWELIEEVKRELFQ